MRAIAYSLIIFWLCLNFTGGIINASNMLPNFSQQPDFTPTDITPKFDSASLLAVGGGVVIGGLVALVTKQYLWSIGAILVWSLGVLIPLVKGFFLSVPLMFTRLGVPSYVSTSLVALVTVVYFMFFVGLVTQRDLQ